MSEPQVYQEEELLQLSGLQHLAFCRRQWALIHLEQQWQENQLTTEGAILHERADDAAFREKRLGQLIVRALPLVSYRLGLSGKADVVEFEQVTDHANSVKLEGRRGHWRPFPVEYKRGKPKTSHIDRIQLCAQALCIEEMMGVTINVGAMFYWEVRAREAVAFTDQLRQKVGELATEMHQLFTRGVTPAAEKRPTCRRCSLKDVCLPELQATESVHSYLQRAIRELDAEEGKSGSA
jgi:CRISPR-associated exonuclease Cas4